MRVVDLADSIYRVELDSPSTTSVPVIAYFLTSRIGLLSNLLFGSWTINSTTLEIEPELTDAQASIFAKIYLIYHFNRLVDNNLGAAAFDSVVDVTSDGATIRKSSKNSTAAIYLQLKKQAQEELNQLLNSYKLLSVAPHNIEGEDSIVGIYNPDTEYVRVP